MPFYGTTKSRMKFSQYPKQQQFGCNPLAAAVLGFCPCEFPHFSFASLPLFGPHRISTPQEPKCLGKLHQLSPEYGIWYCLGCLCGGQPTPLANLQTSLLRLSQAVFLFRLSISCFHCKDIIFALLDSFQLSV